MILPARFQCRLEFERQQRDGDGDDRVAEEDDAVDVTRFLLTLALPGRFVEREVAIALIIALACAHGITQAPAMDEP